VLRQFRTERFFRFLWTPLHFTCHCGITEAARLLLADVNQFGSKPPHFAVEQGAMDIVTLLCERAEIKLGEKNKRMFTPLCKAIRLKHKQIAAFLEERDSTARRIQGNKGEL
jgi:ankyrin repeat protein